MKRKRVGGQEQDLFSRYWRRHRNWQSGERSWIRRKVAKRERRANSEIARTDLRHY